MSTSRNTQTSPMTTDIEAQDPKQGRREFLGKLLGAGVLVAAGAGVVASTLGGADDVPDYPLSDILADPALPGHAWGFVIDLDKCDGCEDQETADCILACRDSHYLPDDLDWLVVWEMEDALGSHFFLPRPCMNCQKAPCQDVCPVGATFYNDDDIVLIDADRCIGCRFCMAACPYQVRVFNWGEPDNSKVPDGHEYHHEKPVPLVKGTVSKCDLCYHETKEGRLPHCVLGCKEDALYYGDFNEDAVTNASGHTLKVSREIRDRAAYQLKAELGTQPRVYYLPPK